MRGILRSAAVALAATTTLSVSATVAWAGGFALREQSAYGQGSSFAGVSAGGEAISSMFWNPATLTLHPGLTLEGNFTLVWPHAEIDVDETFHPLIGDLGTRDSGELGMLKLIPASYAVYQATEDLFLGLAVTSPFGLVTDADLDWSGRFHGRTSDLLTINVNPNVAYRISDMLSVGVGLQAQWIDARLTNAQTVQAGQLIGEGDADLVGNDWGFGFTAGLTFTPSPATTIGLGFRSAIRHKLQGDAEIYDATFPLLGNVGTLDLGDVSAEVTLPEQATLGIRHSLNDRWTLLGQVEWTNWSRFDELRVKFDDPTLPDSVTVEDWEDGWFFAIGAEYKYSPNLTLRGGIAYELSPVPDETRTPRIPDSDRLWLSAGATYQIKERLSLDIGYSHIFAKEASINLDPEPGDPDFLRGALKGENHGSVDIFSVALRYKFGDPAPLPPADPIIRKP